MNKNTIHVKLFDNVKNELLMKRVIGYILSKSKNSELFIHEEIIDIVRQVNTNIADKLEELALVRLEYGYSDVNEFISEFIIKNKDTKELTENYHIKLWEEVKEYFGEVIDLITPETSPETLAVILHRLGRRINNDFYLKPAKERERIPTELPKKVSIFANEYSITRYPTREELINNYCKINIVKKEEEEQLTA